MTYTFREHLQRAIYETFDLETFDQSDEKTLPVQQKGNDNDNDNENDKYF